MTHDPNYQVTARKWRPTEFDSVIGQEHVTTTLKNAITSGRIHHAYLFAGPRGVGKTTTARILAKALNCPNRTEAGDPCGTCESCVAISEGRSIDVVEIDGASNNSVEDIRVLRDNVRYPPVNGEYKLYIIDEVHMLSTSAFNALLKTLEEPPRHLVFVFATTEPHKVLPTILSRCQRFDFRRMQIDDIVSHLEFIAREEKMSPERDALAVIARKADGSMRDAQSIFDQVTAFCGQNFTYDDVNSALNLIDEEVFFRVSKMMESGDVADAFRIVDETLTQGFDIGEFLVGLAEHFRNLLSVQSTGSASLVESPDTIREMYVREANRLSKGDALRSLRLALGTQASVRTASQPRLRLELLLVQLATMDSTVELEELLKEVRTGNSQPTTTSEKSVNPAKPRKPDSDTASSEPSQAASGNGSNADKHTNHEKPRSADAPHSGTERSTKQESYYRSAGEKSDPVVKEPTSGAAKDLKNFPVSPSGGGSAAGMFDSAHSATDVAVETEAVNHSLTIHEIRSQWESFLESYSEKRGLMYALYPAVPGDLRGDVLVLNVESERQRELLRQYRHDIVKSVQSFFSAPLTIDGKVEVAGDSANGNSSTAQNGQSTRKLDKFDDHPFVEGIVELLGAVRL